MLLSEYNFFVKKMYCRFLKIIIRKYNLKYYEITLKLSDIEPFNITVTGDTMLVACLLQNQIFYCTLWHL